MDDVLSLQAMDTESEYTTNSITSSEPLFQSNISLHHCNMSSISIAFCGI